MADKENKKAPKGAKAGAAAKAAPVKASRGPVAPRATPRLQDRYRNTVIAELTKEFGYKNVNQVPRLTKVVINFGLGEATTNPGIVKTTQDELTLIAGQHAVITRAKKAIANFKLRAGLPIGCMVTLRRERMWEFLDQMISIGMPRIRDFKGVSGKAFDGRGNYSLGLKEQTMFPWLDYDKISKIIGFNVTIGSTAGTDAEGKSLLKHLGMPFRN